ncbi:MAG: hypothetical protein Kow0031_17640 [Anaerolineae bacterium]
MNRRNTELWLALAVIVLAGVGYAALARLAGVPSASGLPGHSLGVIGFVMMLGAETLYSLRKRAVTARWGRMATWLRGHIFLGLVGPFLVLLHTGWQFNGLAGLATLLTLIVVASGFVGRYIYTAIPRSADGVALEAGEVQRQIAAAEADLQRWLAQHPGEGEAISRQLSAPAEAAGGGLGPGRWLAAWRFRREWAAQKRQLQAQGVSQLQELETLLKRQQTLRRQVGSMALARQMLAIWHTVHVPMGVTLFVVAFIHIGAALYYATFLH